MIRLMFICDRCHRTSRVLITPDATGGFYTVTDGVWARYARPGEDAVCDECMHKDPRYVADYGRTS